MLFMCLLWVLLQFVVMAMYYDLQPGPHLQRAALAAPEEEEKPLVQHEAGQEERDGQHGYGSTGTAQRAPGEPPEGDEYRYVPNGHLAEEEGREKETSPFQNFSVMRDHGDPHHPALPELRGAGEQHHVLPVRHRGDLRLLPGALPQQPPPRPCDPGARAGHLQRGLCLVPALPGAAPRELSRPADRAGGRRVPAGAGAALRGRLPGLALLQGHSGKNTRVQPGPAAVCGGRRHHSGAPVGWRSDREPLRHAGGDDGPAEPADGYGRALVLLPGGAAQGLRAGTVPGGAALVTSRLSTARPTGLHGSKPPR
nr:uncharacterized protein LOC102453964 isoform X3 [Pelodiscus sinensis]|eukprot:XP_025034963.1 uncharacterized protein LOC102453964 isoform X3 [Pelodiscus sinensis]